MLLYSRAWGLAPLELHAKTRDLTSHVALAAMYTLFADVNLKGEELDGSCVKDVDLQKLYFLYVSSKPDDWKFILEVFSACTRP